MQPSVAGRRFDSVEVTSKERTDSGRACEREMRSWGLWRSAHGSEIGAESNCSGAGDAIERSRECLRCDVTQAFLYTRACEGSGLHKSLSAPNEELEADVIQPSVASGRFNSVESAERKGPTGALCLAERCGAGGRRVQRCSPEFPEPELHE